MTVSSLTHTFVDTIPKHLDDGLLYVSIEFRTTMHLCACGCGNAVVLPLRPTGWSLIYDGNAVSMRPSVGNWSFPCQSHYWIRDGNVVWARQWSATQIEAGRRQALEDRGVGQAHERSARKRRPVWRRILGAIGELLRLKRRSDLA